MSTKMQSKKRPSSDSYSKNGNGGYQKSKFTKTSSDFAARNGKAAQSKSFGKGKAPVKDKAEVIKRKQPITQGGGEVEENDDYEEDDGDEDVEMGENTEPQEKKPRLTKAEKAALHAAQPHRTTLLASYPLLQELSPLWETARRADIGKEERRTAIDALWTAVKGRVGEISKGHKGGRILQTIVKYGGKEERLGVAMELRPQWRTMMESKYSKFLMAKLIRHCPPIRPLLIEDLSPYLSSMLVHAFAVQPLSDFYDLWATAAERKLLLRGLYPKEVKIFDGGKGKAQSLMEVLEAMGEGKGRERVLEGAEKTVLGVFNATQKTALAQSIYHRLVYEYLLCVYQFCSAEEADKKMHELLTAGQESFPEIVHTKDGAAVVRELLVRGNARDRKQILQPLKKHLPAMAKDTEAQTVLFTAFDCVDDTKLMGKAFVSDLTEMTSELASEKNGRRSLLYLLTPTSTRHYMPTTLASLAESAKTARDLRTSKKDPVIRRKEIAGYASPGLLKAVEEKAEEMVRDPGAGLAVQEIMLYATGDKSAAIAALVAPLQIPYPDPAPTEASPDNSTSHVLDLPHAIRTYKTLLSGGHFNASTKTVEVVDPTFSAQFATAVWAAITSEDAGGDENAVRVAKGNAPFVLVEMIAALSPDSREQVKRLLGGKRHAIEAEARKGSALLVERLEQI